jgi:protein-tyrosine phosphatase
VCKKYTPKTSGEIQGFPSEQVTPMVDFLQDEGVVAVVRVNYSDEPGLQELGGSYKPQELESGGIKHIDMPIRDKVGAVPPLTLIREFLEEIDRVMVQSPAKSFGYHRSQSLDWLDSPRRPPTKPRMSPDAGAIAVHCKSGFGRSVVFGCLLVIHLYDVPGRALIGWSRMVRPGCLCTFEQEALLCSIGGRADLHRG